MANKVSWYSSSGFFSADDDPIPSVTTDQRLAKNGERKWTQHASIGFNTVWMANETEEYLYSLIKCYGSECGSLHTSIKHLVMVDIIDVN